MHTRMWSLSCVVVRCNTERILKIILNQLVTLIFIRPCDLTADFRFIEMTVDQPKILS